MTAGLLVALGLRSLVQFVPAAALLVEIKSRSLLPKPPKPEEEDPEQALIARLTAQLRCYLPEPVDETWGRLRHLGQRRARLLGVHTESVQQIRALLECVWPAALETAKHPFKSHTWIAALHVIVSRDGGDLALTRRRGLARFEHQVGRELIRRGYQRPCRRIVTRLFTALDDPAGVLEHRRSAFERISWILDDFDHAHTQLVEVDQRLVAVLDELGLTKLVTSIDGLSAVGAAAMNPGGAGAADRDPGRDRT